MKVVGMKAAKVFVLTSIVNVLVPSLGCLHLQGQFVSPVRVCSFCLLRDIPEELNE